MKNRSKKWWALTDRQRRSDRGTTRAGYYNAPASYRRERAEQYWSECHTIFQKAVKNDDFDDLVFPIYRKDAAWYYW